MDSTANKKPAGHDARILAHAESVLSGIPTIKTAGPVRAVGSDAVVVVPDIAELPRAVRQRVKALSQDEWTEADWQDLLNTQRLLEHNIASRHGLLEQHNAEISHDPERKTKK